MARKSSIAQLAAPVKAAIDDALKSDRLTLDELLDWLRGEYPDERLPSRSSLGRYKQDFDERQKGLTAAFSSADALANRLVQVLVGDEGAAIVEACSKRKIVRVIVLEFADEAGAVDPLQGTEEAD